MASIEQITALIDYMERNPEMALGQCTRTKEGRSLAKRRWTECADVLNSVSSDCTQRSADSWRLYFNEYKCKLLKKIKAEKASVNATGQSANKKYALTPLQMRLYDILERDVEEITEWSSPQSSVYWNDLKTRVRGKESAVNANFMATGGGIHHKGQGDPLSPIEKRITVLPHNGRALSTPLAQCKSISSDREEIPYEEETEYKVDVFKSRESSSGHNSPDPLDNETTTTPHQLHLHARLAATAPAIAASPTTTAACPATIAASPATTAACPTTIAAPTITAAATAASHTTPTFNHATARTAVDATRPIRRRMVAVQRRTHQAAIEETRNLIARVEEIRANAELERARADARQAEAAVKTADAIQMFAQAAIVMAKAYDRTTRKRRRPAKQEDTGSESETD